MNTALLYTVIKGYHRQTGCRCAVGHITGLTGLMTQNAWLFTRVHYCAHGYTEAAVAECLRPLPPEDEVRQFDQVKELEHG